MSAPSDRINIVLVGTTHPGNIGAVARAMKNMARSRLCLVQPRIFPSADATARAAGADDILAGARVCDDLEAAVADSVLVVGASARPRSLGCPLITPRECAALVTDAWAADPVALVFGREHSGLSNEELDLCHYQLHIPSNPDFTSLNLAAAVQIVCYELFLACAEATGAAAEGAPVPGAAVSHEDMERFYQHLEMVLTDLGFLDPGNPRQLMRRLRRLYNRLHPDRNELNILRGILTAIQDHGATLRRRNMASSDRGGVPQVD